MKSTAGLELRNVNEGTNARYPSWDDTCAGLSDKVKTFALRWGLNMQEAMEGGVLLADIAQQAADDAGGKRLNTREEQQAFLALQKGWKYYAELLEWRRTAVAPKRARKK